MTRSIHVADMGRRTIGRRARDFLASLGEADRDVLWDMLSEMPEDGGKDAKAAVRGFLAEHGQPLAMRRHLLAVGSLTAESSIDPDHLSLIPGVSPCPNDL